VLGSFQFPTIAEMQVLKIVTLLRKFYLDEKDQAAWAPCEARPVDLRLFSQPGNRFWAAVWRNASRVRNQSRTERVYATFVGRSKTARDSLRNCRQSAITPRRLAPIAPLVKGNWQHMEAAVLAHTCWSYRVSFDCGNLFWNIEAHYGYQQPALAA